MLKKENRLVPGIRFNNSRFLVFPQFILKEKENKLGISRFGIVVSKKIDKRAVVRNRIKRFFRDALSALVKVIMPGHDILIIVKKEVLCKTGKENLIAIKSILEKAGVLQNI